MGMRGNLVKRKIGFVHALLLFIILILLFIILFSNKDSNDLQENDFLNSRQKNRKLESNYNYEIENGATNVKSERHVSFNRNIPLVWIGGIPRSGTTLARAMLDAHPLIRCGEETRVIPRLLGLHSQMDKSRLEKSRLKEAKITDDILNDALGAYILTIILKHGDLATRYCNKDPFALRSINRLHSIFPKSKFILVVRDGRATVNSIVSRHVTIKGFNVKSYKGALIDWNRAITNMYNQCQAVSNNHCIIVHYEQLVLHPEQQMRRILNFLDIPWDDVVLHHEKSIGKAGGVSLSKKELSSDQVTKPINTAALEAWVKDFPLDFRHEVPDIAPMLEVLGYDPHAYPPNYGKPDAWVKKQSTMLKNHYWHQNSTYFRNS